MDLRGIVRAAVIAAAAVWSVGVSGCSKTLVPESVSVKYDTFTDERDGKKYRTVVIGGQRWIAENLNYETPDGSWCYENDTSNCDKYGRLYDWETARKACPAGYHLPSHEEWDDLGRAVGGEKKYHVDFANSWEDAGKKLKATRGWTWNNNSNGNGTDDYGFFALPGGYRHFSGGARKFDGVGVSGEWWTDSHSGFAAFSRSMDYNRDDLYANGKSMGDGFSVRCVQDDGETGGDTSWKSAQTLVTLSRDGTLRVKPRFNGGGAMEDYLYRGGLTGWVEYNQYPGGVYAPWLDDDSLITSVLIEDGVTHIGDFTFIELYNLKSVTIPPSVSSIGQSAFDKCINLASVTISGGGVTSIEKSAFNRCVNLTSVTIPNSVTYIGRSAFINSGLTSVAIPNSVTYIDDMAFAHCTSLTSVIIPSGVTVLGSSAFFGCVGLTSVTIQNGEITVGDGVFHSCHGLTSVTLPDAMRRISSTMFYACTSLTSITLPKKLSRIDWNAFAGCKKLTSIISRNPEPPPYVHSNAFDGINLDDVCLYVPAGSLKAYLYADVWKKFYCAHEIDEKTKGISWLWLAICVITALTLSVVILVIIRNLRKSSRKGVA